MTIEQTILDYIPTIKATDTWTPLSHKEVLNKTIELLEEHGYTIALCEIDLGIKGKSKAAVNRLKKLINF